MAGTDDNFTYQTERESPCRILPGRQRQDLSAIPHGPVSAADNARLTRAGFDKSFTLAAYFKQACGTCNACKPARIVVNDYHQTRSDRQVINRNRDLIVNITATPDEAAHQALFLRNFADRHENAYDTFQQLTIRHSFRVAAMLKHPMVSNMVMEVRTRESGQLLGASIFDDCGDGLKGHYYYYEPGLPAARSMGTFMVLQMIEQARLAGKDYLYLGALTREPSKISYKARFQPLEILEGSQWLPLKPVLK
ncbi:MAG: hypothetical protein KKA05_03670 [Alphaproteobacteria bacterium]|nr:hypothetical protein [Alphaproteobacteria bacterium]